jgi:hypothetical protein
MMAFYHKLLIAFSSCLLFMLPVLGQDSTGAVRNWKTGSQKKGNGLYELTFSGLISKGWQVYSPDQTLLEVKTTELKFGDSAITQQGDFVKEGTPKEISSPIFDNSRVSVYEDSVRWRCLLRSRVLYLPGYRALCIIHMESRMNFIHPPWFLLSRPWKVG